MEFKIPEAQSLFASNICEMQRQWMYASLPSSYCIDANDANDLMVLFYWYDFSYQMAEFMQWT